MIRVPGAGSSLLAVAVRCRAGETVQFRPRGNSMKPYVRDGELVTVRPLPDGETIRKGDIVLAKVARTLYLHFVIATDGSGDAARVLIGNVHGRLRGWTSRANVYGILVRKEKED
jgi:peptidase S24-like protein